MRAIGKNQKSVLESLQQHGYWHAGCGWVWDTTRGTERLLNSLVRRGLVHVVQRTTWNGYEINSYELSQ
jgi:hypothetical protein